MMKDLFTNGTPSFLTQILKNLSVIGLLLLGSFQTQAQVDTIVIVFAPTATPGDIAYFKTAMNAKELDITYPSEARLWKVRCHPWMPCHYMGDDYIDVNEVIKKVSSETKTESIGKNYFTFTPSFTTIPVQDLQGPFTPNKLAGCSGVPIAETKGTANEGITIALIDSGVDAAHPFFDPSYFTGSSRTFIGADPFNDYKGHGTHIAGIIRIMDILGGGATSFKIMNLQTQKPDGSGKIWDAIRAVDYANTHGADIINMSLGYVHDPLIDSIVGVQPLEVAINKANQLNNVLVVASAGNDAQDIDVVRHYPSAFACDNLISVASDSCATSFSYSFSNFGAINVDLAAPGERILGPNLYGATPLWTRKTGTSMAAGIITGAVAILATYLPHPNDGQLKCAIIDGADYKGYPVMTQGTLHTPDALNSLLYGICVGAPMLEGEPERNTTNAIAFENDMKTNIDAYPHPFSHSVNIQFIAKQEGQGNWFVFDAYGRVIDGGEIHAVEGLNKMQWNGSHVKSGLYYINIDLPGQRSMVKKMMKQWE